MSFIDTIHDTLTRAISKPAILEMTADGEVETTRAQLQELIGRARSSLASCKVQPGDRVVLVGPNSAQWAAADLAILGAGAVCVPMYARQAADELVAMMKDCDARQVIVATRELGDAITAHWPDAPILPYDLLFYPDAAPTDVVDRSDDDLVTLIYTSGTSGEPKGVMLDAANIDHMLPVTAAALTELMQGHDGDERVFHYLPFCFAGSRVVLWTCLFRGQPIRISQDLDRLIDEIGEAQPHYFLNVPVLLERVRNGAEAAFQSKGPAVWWLYQRARRAYAHELERGSMRKRDWPIRALADRLLFQPVKAKLGPNIRFLICGSAPLSEDTQRWFELIGVPVYQVYGLTETTAIVTMDQPGRVAAGAVGYAIDGCEMKLGDQDELLVRGPNVFSGYWNRPEATQAAFDDGWFRTGDQCTLTPEGRLAVIGRVKNLLVPTSGHNVPPEPIEARLSSAITGAEQVVLLGHGRPFLTALVTGEVGEATIQAGVDAVNATLPHYKRVRKWHTRTEPLTDAEGLLTANGKLRRAAIEDHFADAIEALYR